MYSVPFRHLFLILVVLAGTSVGCRSDDTSAADTPTTEAALSVVVSIVPQVDFARRIGGGLVDISVLAPGDHSPETYQVTPRQMDLLSRADVYFRIGMPFETGLVARLSASCPNLTIVDTRENVALLTIEGHHDHDHDHDEPGHNCSVDGADPHIWLDPLRVKQQAQTMAIALAALAPVHEAVFMANLEAFKSELDALHVRLSEILAAVRGKTVYVFHPDLGYLADAYGFHQHAIEHEGKSPGARRLYALIDEIKAANVRSIFSQPQFGAREVHVIADATGAEVVLLDNLASNYMDNMEYMARTIAAHL